MADLNQLKQKYQPVLDVLAKEDATIQALDLQGDKLHSGQPLSPKPARIAYGTRSRPSIPTSPTSPTKSPWPKASRPTP